MGGMTPDLIDDLYQSNLLSPPDDAQAVRKIKDASKRKQREDPGSVSDTDFDLVTRWWEPCKVASVIVQEDMDDERNGQRYTFVTLAFQVDGESASRNRNRFFKWFGRLYWDVPALKNEERAEQGLWGPFFRTREAAEGLTNLIKATGFVHVLHKGRLINDSQIPADELEGMRVDVHIEQGPNYAGTEDEDRVLGYRKSR